MGNLVCTSALAASSRTAHGTRAAIFEAQADVRFRWSPNSAILRRPPFASRSSFEFGGNGNSAGPASGWHWTSRNGSATRRPN